MFSNLIDQHVRIGVHFNKVQSVLRFAKDYGIYFTLGVLGQLQPYLLPSETATALIGILSPIAILTDVCWFEWMMKCWLKRGSDAFIEAEKGLLLDEQHLRLISPPDRRAIRRRPGLHGGRGWFPLIENLILELRSACAVFQESIFRISEHFRAAILATGMAAGSLFLAVGVGYVLQRGQWARIALFHLLPACSWILPAASNARRHFSAFWSFYQIRDEARILLNQWVERRLTPVELAKKGKLVLHEMQQLRSETPSVCSFLVYAWLRDRNQSRATHVVSQLLAGESIR